MIPPPMPNTAEMDEVMNAAIIKMKVSTIENLGLKLNYMGREINYLFTQIKYMCKEISYL